MTDHDRQRTLRVLYSALVASDLPAEDFNSMAEEFSQGGALPQQLGILLQQLADQLAPPKPRSDSKRRRAKPAPTAPAAPHATPDPFVALIDSGVGRRE